MSDTPRTDKICRQYSGNDRAVKLTMLAMELERELAEAKALENHETPASGCTVKGLVLLSNAITEACREIQACPDDSIQDIFNESLETWETRLRMDHNFNLEPNKELSNTEGGEG